MTEPNGGPLEETAETFKLLAYHAVVVVGAFLIIFGLALALHAITRGIVTMRWVEAGGPHYLAMVGAEYFLLLVDVAFLIGVIGKLTLRSFRQI